MVTVFLFGAAGTVIDAITTLRVCFGTVIILLLVRYRYALLIAWALLDGLNAASFLRGSNLLVGLTIPTLLLLFSMPIYSTFSRMKTLTLLMIYLLWVFASIGISAIGAGTFLVYWTQLLDCLAVAVLTINILNTRKRMLRLIDAILLQSTAIAIYGIYGFFAHTNGVSDPSTSLFRIFSIFPAAPGLALFLSVVIPLAIFRTFTLQANKRAIGVLVVLILVMANVLTFTRSAIISMPLSLVIMVLFLPRGKMKSSLLYGMAVLAIVIAVLTIVGNVPIYNRFFNQDVTTLNGRTYLWNALLEHFDPTQLLGNGLRAADGLLANLQVGINGQGLIATSPSNLFLGTLYDHGIIGLLLLLSLCAVLFLSLIAGVRQTTGERRTLFIVAIAVFVSVLVQSLDSNDFWDQAISIYIWFVMALPFALVWSLHKQQEQVKTDCEIFNAETIPHMEVVDVAGGVRDR
jgi:O-antigen ligase